MVKHKCYKEKLNWQRKILNCYNRNSGCKNWLGKNGKDKRRNCYTKC